MDKRVKVYEVVNYNLFYFFPINFGSIFVKVNHILH